MTAQVARTLEELHGAAAARLRLVVRVLCYDDLLADRTQVYPLPDTAHPLAVAIGRADQLPQEGLRAAAPGTGLHGELRLHDRFLSGTHAVLLSRDGSDVLRDQNSRNGTYVNGARLREGHAEHVLCDGDLIEVGHTLLCYRVLDERSFSQLQLGVAQGVTIGPTRTFCAEMMLLVRDLHRVAPSRESVLLLSESGTGKEVAAQMIHQHSGRGPYCTIDAGAVPESLFESVFFGHRRGAFTGAAADQVGHLLRAHGGTLFLDEAANMSPASQAKLLRVIEDGQVTPLGAATAHKVDLRWVAATNVNLFAESVPFRKDLLRRLSGYVARIPPLRRRREDLGVLSAHFLRETGVLGAVSISAAAGRRLFNDRFAGNVRQLRSVLRSAVLLAPDGKIDQAQLASLETATVGLTPPLRGGPPEPRLAAIGSGEGTGTDVPVHPLAVALPSASGPAPGEARRPPPTVEAIVAALRATRGNVVRAAQRLDLHPRQLYRWIERFSIDLQAYRD